MITLADSNYTSSMIQIKQMCADFRKEDISGLSGKAIFARNMPIWEPTQSSQTV